jgi:nucleotide-binding universal stress UspA family protein
MAVVHKILTPTDGSETAEAAVRFAKDIALAEDADVVVLGVVHDLQYGDTAEVDATPTIEVEMKNAVEHEVEELKEAGVRATGDLVPGAYVHEAIAKEAADIGADLIVMGTHGRSGLGRTVIGSVADRVVRHTEVPVLLVPQR